MGVKDSSYQLAAPEAFERLGIDSHWCVSWAFDPEAGCDIQVDDAALLCFTKCGLPMGRPLASVLCRAR